MAIGLKERVTSHDLLARWMDRPRGAQGQGHPITGEISGANSGSQWFLLVGRLIGISVLLTPLVPLATSRLQTVSGYLYPSQSQVPERPCLSVNMRYIGGMEALVGGRNLAWKFMVLECTSSMGSVTCTRLPTCLTDVGFGQRFT